MLLVGSQKVGNPSPNNVCNAIVLKRTLSDDTRWEIKSFFKKKMEKKT